MSNASFTKLQNTVVSPETLTVGLDEATIPTPYFVEGTVTISDSTGSSFTGADGGVIRLPAGLCVRTVEVVGGAGATGGGLDVGSGATGVIIGLSSGSGAFSSFAKVLADIGGATAVAGRAVMAGFCVTGSQYLVIFATGVSDALNADLRVRCQLVPLRV